MKRIIWWVVTRTTIFCTGYINWDKNHPAGRQCEDCSDYGKWSHCDNCIYQCGGEKHDNWRPK